MIRVNRLVNRLLGRSPRQPTPTPAPPAPAGWQAEVRQAQEAAERRDWAAAAVHYGRALETHDDFGLRVQHGHMLKEAGDLDAAAAAYAHALALRPDDADLALQMGHFHWLTGDAARSLESYRRAAALDPANPDAVRHVRIGEERLAGGGDATVVPGALAAMDAGRWAEAEAALRPLVEGGQASLGLLLGHAVRWQGRPDEAAGLYAAYLSSLDPAAHDDRMEGEFQLAHALKAARRFSEAALHFSEARRIRLEVEGWVGSSDDLMDEIQDCIRRVHPAIDANAMRGDA